MADLELVIKIPEDIRAAIGQMGLLRIPNEMTRVVDKAIQHGTPLPKGHGRLIDADNIDNHIIGHVDTRSCPTIIEADKGSEDKE